ncbi:hypothetical protein TIFTF001_016713 [Ficus carica]|uniref:Uncharacterized protein n=1 Tax=Ficus carica TaxID=3494 RepID=A0AA88A0W8_FICCA|nr:hypothetical protein TIFTF001_016713 [Ficus carica]
MTQVVLCFDTHRARSLFVVNQLINKDSSKGPHSETTPQKALEVEVIKPQKTARNNFLTQEDIIALLERHEYSISPKDAKYVPEPPYPMEICLKPYPQGYETPIFSRGDNLVDFVQRFRDLALECYDENDEGALINICINNINLEYRVHLENVSITQFSRLSKTVEKTALSVRVNESPREWNDKRRNTPQSFAALDRDMLSARESKIASKKARAQHLIYLDKEVIDLDMLPDIEKDKSPRTAAAVIHSGDPIEGYAPDPRTSVVQALYRSPKFKSLFDQLGLGQQALLATTNSLWRVSTKHGPQCYANKAIAS